MISNETQFQLDLAVMGAKAGLDKGPVEKSFQRELFHLIWDDFFFEIESASDFCEVLEGIEEDDKMTSGKPGA